MGRYDMFMSFRGEDTGVAFISHLYYSLTNARIVVFKDDVNLLGGNNISAELSFGIEHSTISIIIFSKDYADSRWCLNELSNVMELHRAQRQVVLPVFYDVNPTDVCHQSSDFGDAFEDLIQRISPTDDQVMRWRDDLHQAGRISGFVVLNSTNENEVIQRIVRRACAILDNNGMFIIARAMYDVFYSFRGYDVRASFAARLHSSLSNAGIIAFKDDDDSLKGLEILTALFLGIEHSAFSMLIFSRNYARSRWCLDELSKIMDLRKEQGRRVLPVFYGVDPSEVRHQSGSFGEAFEDLKIKTSENKSKWRADLHQAASLSGFVVVNSRNENEVIQRIVRLVCEILDRKDKYDRARYDVFLSYTGYDMRTSFTAHLNSSLINTGIVVFNADDDSLKGLSVEDELLRGIERSTISIVIFSKNYARSRWRLDKLSKIMDLREEQGRVVLPVFYCVEPFEVRHQSSSFGEAFEYLKIMTTENVMSKWRANLHHAASLPGFVVVNSRNEVEDIKIIVEHVCSELEKKGLFIAKHPVGVDSR